ncbi:50S ribosomal protein L3 [Symbiodinium microadriaticum]|uniref:Large ribosomal subunit protein uL3m n=1 Tax=Symbiodinium microadriaticum TaxID=2951 RepID=A0A1Q9CQ15_SYMMI|nr:50S ribosomal protein L3 [Symbiodinium microadriaticum]CAE7567023.1 RPL3B [Symbiodinium microadriaticum]CAE7777245.1 RPL3B [Symbiodinium sp. KB8]
MWRTPLQPIKAWALQTHRSHRFRHLPLASTEHQVFRQSQRGFFASKWQKRLGHLLEGRRRPPAPDVPDKEQLTNDFGIKPCKPVLGSKRTGVLAYKIGCMSLWDEWGVKHMVTVCQLDRLHVVQSMTLQKNGYEALQLGLGYRSIHRLSRPELGTYMKAGVGPKHHKCEFRVSSDCLLPPGLELSVRHFVPGQWVFVSGWSKGRGYHGVMKRWGFSGGGSDFHGHKKSHRSAGSLGQRGIGKVWVGKKMAGHKGPDPRCVNAKVFRIESTRNLIFLKGALPGYKGSVVKISDARGKTALKNNHIRLPYPTFVPVPGVEYPVTIQEPPPQRDPFLYPEQPLYQPND